MQYELKEWKQNGPLKDNGNNTSTQPIMVWTKIVNETYGFEKTDSTVITFNNSLSIPQAIIACTDGAIAFVASKYPNT